MGRKSKDEGMDVYRWLVHFAIQWKLTQDCKATVLQLKKIISHVTKRKTIRKI